MIKLNNAERLLAEKLEQLKNKSGTHSPSFHAIRELGIQVDVDACFLSNPYATDLFIEYLNRELVETNELRKYIELYPSQNERIAEMLSKRLDIPSDYLFIGNGAIEIIQALLHRKVRGKLAIPIPTFSSYYEFLTDKTEPIYYHLSKDDDYKMDVKDYVSFIELNAINNALLINPNNPDGGYLSGNELKFVLDRLIHLDNIILDESFIHFANAEDKDLVRNEDLVREYPNLVIIKSLSKDFGIAGIRCGYAVMQPSLRMDLLKNGFLWNSSGLSEYFFGLYANDVFYNKYLEVRELYVRETAEMYSRLSGLNGIKVIPTCANFFLIELLDGTSSHTLFTKLMLSYGVYVRNCSDKIGLAGEYIRVASRSKTENEVIIMAFEELYG